MTCAGFKVISEVDRDQMRNLVEQGEVSSKGL
jgi:hypothetical protein